MGYVKYENLCSISDIVGKTFIKVEADNDEIRFYIDDNTYYLMYHSQNCCESVYIEDINGDLQDLVGTPILVAEDREYDAPAISEYDDSFTWTFYCIRTIKGSVDIRWYGSSNGYYSESVEFGIAD